MGGALLGAAERILSRRVVTILFNASTVIDRSTFSDPMVLSAGIEKVLVGGELVWDGGKPAPEGAGAVLVRN